MVALWRRLSAEEARRQGWWDDALRGGADRGDPRTEKALRDRRMAERLVQHLARELDWPMAYYRGFSCLDGLPSMNDSTGPAMAAAGPAGPTHDESAVVARLIDRLLECRPLPCDRGLEAIAHDASLPLDRLVGALATALRRGGRIVDAARMFDAALVVQLDEPMERREDEVDLPITVVEDYRRYRIVLHASRFYAVFVAAPASDRFRFDANASTPDGASAGNSAADRGDRTERREVAGPAHDPTFVADHFDDVIAMIESADSQGGNAPRTKPQG